MKKKVTLAVLIGLIVLLLAGVFLVVMMKVTAQDAGQEEKPKDITMFSAYTECEEFQNVPAMAVEDGVFSDAADYGDDDWAIHVSGSTTEEYQAYLITLEEAGFQKHSDNGEDAMEGYAYSASYTKDNLTLTVSHAIKENHTYIMAAFDKELSPHLIYQDAYMDGVTADAKTSVHMLELHDNGNSFVIQLKNGHFIVHDGGNDIDAPYLLDYLEELAPGDEKPVIEAWFISHAHSDHVGAILEIAKDTKQTERVYVEGIYFSAPTTKLYDTLTIGKESPEIGMMTARINRAFKNEAGEITKIYRPQFGQRYYFCDMTIDVSLAMEQIPDEAFYTNDFNDTSIWLMHHIEGQRFLIAGDTSNTGIRIAMNMFEEEYFDLDVFAVFHHGINVYDYFTDYCTLKTVLYTSFREASIWEPSREDLAAVEQNEHLRQSCEEYVSHGGGTVVVTFPYKVGEYKKLEPCDWRYDNGIQQKGTWEG